MAQKFCGICGRELDIEGDSLSADCGGDCWGCIGEIEADSGHELSMEIVREEFRRGLRRNWVPAPSAKIQLGRDHILVSVALTRPLGEPWPSVEFSLTLSSWSTTSRSYEELARVSKLSGADGSVEHVFAAPPSLLGQSLHVGVHRSDHIWYFPVQK